MLTPKSNFRRAREGQGPYPRQKRPVPPKTRLLAKPRTQRTASEIDDHLIDRGDITMWIDPGALNAGRSSGRGRAYPDAVITLAMVIGAIFNFPLRQTQGYLRGLARTMGLDCDIPTFSTLCRRRCEVELPFPVGPPGPRVLVLDATGFTVLAPGEWLRQRSRDPRRAQFIKLHACVDQQTSQLVSFTITPGDGRGSGDVSQGPVLVRKAAEHHPITAVLGDRAYDAESVYRATADAGGRFVTEPKSKARYGTHVHRDDHIAQIGLLGPPEWKRRVGYGQRNQIESWFSGLKRTLGARVRATTLEGAVAELTARLLVYANWVKAAST